MSEDVIRKLAGFTPAPPAVDRDDLLFRAGRASAPSPRWWRRAVVGLVVTQTVTLALWLGPRDLVQVPAPPVVPPPEVLPAEPPEASSYLVLSHHWPGDTVPTTASSASPEAPRLTAGSRFSFD